jgi:hypothetical protein
MITGEQNNVRVSRDIFTEQLAESVRLSVAAQVEPFCLTTSLIEMNRLMCPETFWFESSAGGRSLVFRRSRQTPGLRVG